MFFPFVDYWWFYAAFTAFVLLLLAVDLGLFHRNAHEVTVRESPACRRWVGLAMAFNYGFLRSFHAPFGAEAGRQLGPSSWRATS